MPRRLESEHKILHDQIDSPNSVMPDLIRHPSVGGTIYSREGVRSDNVSNIELQR